MPPKKHARTEQGDADEASAPIREEARTSSAEALSLNPVFACTGPRAGLLSFSSGMDALNALLDVVDDPVYQALHDAWDAVGVPAADYWRARPLVAVTAPAQQHSSAGIGDAAEVIVPDACALSGSFYGSRLSALRGRAYRTNAGLALLAVDRRVGNGSKLFNVLPRRHVADFISAIPRSYDRSLYVVLDEQAPLDPYFDIDCSFTAAADSPQTGGGGANRLADVFPGWTSESGAYPVDDQRVEELLHVILTFLHRYVGKHIGAAVEQCLVLTSSMQLVRARGQAPGELVELKLSFHVHFRLRDRHAIACVRDMHLFMSQLRERLEMAIETPSAPEVRRFFEGVVDPTVSLKAVALMARRCVDFGVYSRWRAFRLPYNVKTPFATAHGAAAPFTPVDAAVDDLLAAQLLQCGVVPELPDVSPGAAASRLVQTVVLPADPTRYATQHSLVRKMSHLFRFLLPIVGGVTRLQYAPLKALVEAHAPQLPPTEEAPPPEGHRKRFAAAVVELAMIQRDDRVEGQRAAEAHATPAGAAHDSRSGDASEERLQCIRFPEEAVAAPGATAAVAHRSAAEAQSGPFALPMPPMPHSARVAVTEAATKELLAEVFRCLAPEYAGAPSAADSSGEGRQQSSSAFALSNASAIGRITGDHISAQYEESIRSFYVMQKQNKYCLRQRRAHKATYAQLYLTYGSIKLRCYANDCCDRCIYVPWVRPRTPSEGGQAAATGYPKYERLAAIRSQLFTELPLEELVRRYGPQVLDRVREQQQQSERHAEPPQQAETAAAA